MPDARQKQTSQVQQQHAQGFNLFNSRFNYDNLNSTHLTAKGVPKFGNGIQPPYPYDNEPNNASISNSNNNNNSHNMVPMQQFRRNTQPVASFNQWKGFTIAPYQMKFADHLTESAIPEWRDKYIDYKVGKKKLRRYKEKLDAEELSSS